MRRTVAPVIALMLIAACGGPEPLDHRRPGSTTVAGLSDLVARWTPRGLEVAPEQLGSVATVTMPGIGAPTVVLQLDAPRVIDQGYLELDAMGVPPGAISTEARPLFLYAVNNDDSDEELAFALSPSPGLARLRPVGLRRGSGALVVGGQGPGAEEVPVLVSASETLSARRTLDWRLVTVQRVGACPARRNYRGWVPAGPCQMGAEAGLAGDTFEVRTDTFRLGDESSWSTALAFSQTRYTFRWLDDEHVEIASSHAHARMSTTGLMSLVLPYRARTLSGSLWWNGREVPMAPAGHLAVPGDSVPSPLTVREGDNFEARLVVTPFLLR